MRAEGLQASNHSIRMQISCEEIANITGGCLGMCGEITSVRYEVQRGILGDKT